MGSDVSAGQMDAQYFDRMIGLPAAKVQIWMNCAPLAGTPKNICIPARIADI
jgi:hypothetical protein